MKNFTLNRRHVLRGMLSGGLYTLALPPLEAMLNVNGNAYANGESLPVRYGTFFWGNGVRPDRYVPNATGNQWWSDPNETLQPIADNAAIRDYITVLSNFDLAQNGVGHHTGRAQMLTGTYDVSKGTYGAATGPSIDYHIAEAFEGQARLRSIDLGISRANKNGGVASGQTSRGPTGDSLGCEMSTEKLFDRIFGTGFTPGSTAANQAIVNARKSIVDAVREDAQALKNRLGMHDRQRIDAHLDGLFTLETAIDGLAAQTCEKPEKQTDNFSANRSHEFLEEKNKVMADMMAIALACDVSRVFTYQYNTMQADTIFWQIGGVQGAHVQTHDDRNVPTDEKIPAQYERVFLSTRLILSDFGYLCQALANMPEGDGSVLDNTLIYATTEVNDGTKHSRDDMPIILAGRAGGKIRSGQHFRAPSARNTTDVLLTCINAVGVPSTSFGQGASQSSTVVSEILV